MRCGNYAWEARFASGAPNQRPEADTWQVSFGAILTPLGLGLLGYGFGAFFQILPGADIAAIMLIYGFPLSILGFALSYAQLKPVPCKTTKEAMALRDSQMTDIQKQVGFCGYFGLAGGFDRCLSRCWQPVQQTCGQTRHARMTNCMKCTGSGDEQVDSVHIYWSCRCGKMSHASGTGTNSIWTRR